MIKILVPVDFSNASLNALFYAINLFKGESSEITVLNSYEIRSTAFSIKSMDSILEKDAKAEMDSFLRKVRKEAPDVILKPKLIKDNAVSAISSLGDTRAYDFIVMGTKGASGLKEVFMGSIAGGVITKTSAPVIVVPIDYNFKQLDEIVLAVGDKPFSKSHVLEPLRKIVNMHRSKLKVLHIAGEKTPEIEKTLLTIGDLNPSVAYAFGTGHTNKDLNEYLMKNSFGLLCLIRQKKGFFESLFNSSVTLKQTFSSPVPLLILHD